MSRARAAGEGQGAGSCQRINNVTRSRPLSPAALSPGVLALAPGWDPHPRGTRRLRQLQAPNPENSIQRKKRGRKPFLRSTSTDFLSTHWSGQSHMLLPGPITGHRSRVAWWSRSGTQPSRLSTEGELGRDADSWTPSRSR